MICAAPAHCALRAPLADTDLCVNSAHSSTKSELALWSSNPEMKIQVGQNDATGGAEIATAKQYGFHLHAKPYLSYSGSHPAPAPPPFVLTS